jgi:hypothetical protein
MADESKQADELENLPAGLDQEPDLWDWARTAGVSREELLAAVEGSRATLTRRV